MNVFEWIEKEMQPVVCNSVEFMYDDMESQSGHCLPIIYQPFNPQNKAHWRDRGFCYDYLYATQGAGKKLLDFGPGDGWPSLIVAPFANEIFGVDGSKHRVHVCTQNAKRLGITNTTFLHITPGKQLPFDRGFFDGIMAASSIEQTPDPRLTLDELYRVLKPGGRLRMHYESLGYYADGKEQELFLEEISGQKSMLTLYDRHIKEEYAIMYKITFSLNSNDLKQHFLSEQNDISIAMITAETLSKLHNKIADIRTCRLYHPSGQTYISLLKETGFAQIAPTHNGAWAAEKLFGTIQADQKPQTMTEIDELIKPIVKVIIQMPALVGVAKSWDPMITAVK